MNHHDMIGCGPCVPHPAPVGTFVRCECGVEWRSVDEATFDAHRGERCIVVGNPEETVYWLTVEGLGPLLALTRIV